MVGGTICVNDNDTESFLEAERKSRGVKKVSQERLSNEMKFFSVFLKVE